jgi:hypothetical protein
VGDSEGAQPLEIDEDLGFHRVQWRTQRIGWGAMVAVIVAALCGFLGHGPFSHATARVPDGSVQVQFSRRERYQSLTSLGIRFAPRDTSREVHIWIDRKYLGAFEINAVVPTPQHEVVERDRIGYVFDMSGTRAGSEATWWLRPNRFGPITARIQMDGGPLVQFRQFIFP